MALKKAGKLEEFFLILCGHPGVSPSLINAKEINEECQQWQAATSAWILLVIQ